MDSVRAANLSRTAFYLAMVLVFGGIVMFIYAVYLGLVGQYEMGLTASGEAIVLLLASGASTFVSVKLVRRTENDNKKS